MTHALLGSEFARELEAMRRLLVVRARSGRAGDRFGKRRGGSAEFLEHRSYDRGDDVRRVDWLAYARTGEPKVKLFREDEDVIVRLAVDSSASMALGTPSKLDFAVRVAAAVGYLALAASERAEVVPLGSGPTALDPSPHRGRSALPAILRELAALGARGQVDLCRELDETVVRARRPGLLVVVSDFLDFGPLEDHLGRAAAAGHDLVLVHVLAREDVAPSLEGDFTLVDAETGEELLMTADGAAVAAFEAQVAAHGRGLHGVARRHGGTYLRAVSDEPLLPLMKRLVGRASDAVELQSHR